MFFNSVPFALFFSVFFVAYWLLARRRRARHLLILAGSYFFYGWWDWRFLGLILVSTLVDYAAGLLLVQTEKPRQRRLLVACSLAANLGILGFFKYFDFFSESAARMLGDLGFHVDPFVLALVLPPGISFYTFQTLSYTLDIYRRKLEPTESFLDFACFVAFFPQLVAGPILRASHFLPQMTARKDYEPRAGLDGLYLVLRGLFKKIVIADTVARLVVDPVFGVAGVPAALSGFNSLDVLAAAYGFSLQIYCDFSGYSDIAIGLSQLLGFSIPDNFRSPFKADSIKNLWERWHISLSTWFRDYVYIPLGGSRVGRVRHLFNLVATFTISGLWHGAAWTFVVWGLIHGIFRALESVWETLRGGSASSGRLKRLIRIALVFHVTVLAFVIFRAASLTHAWGFLGRIFDFDFTSPSSLGRGGLLLVLGGLLLHWIPENWIRGLRSGFRRIPLPALALLIALLFGLFGLLQSAPKPFIYFQF